MNHCLSILYVQIVLSLSVTKVLLIEAYSQYTTHHSDLLTLKSLISYHMILGEFWPIFSDTLFTKTARNRTITIDCADLTRVRGTLKEFCSIEKKDFQVLLGTTLQA